MESKKAMSGRRSRSRIMGLSEVLERKCALKGMMKL